MNASGSMPWLLQDLRHKLKRRSFLLGGLAFATSASTVLSGCSSPPGSATTGQSLRALLVRLVPVVLPKGTPLHPASPERIGTALDGILADMEPSVIADLETAVTLFEYGGGLMTGRFSRFSTLSDSDAQAVLEHWQNGASLQRGIATVFKKLIYLAYWHHQDTWTAVEFDGPVSVKWGLPSLGNAPFPEEVSRG